VTRTIPIYTDPEETYQADTCLPLLQGAQQGEIRLEALVHGHYPGRPLPRGALPAVKTLGFWDAMHDQSWGLDWHRNEGIELSLLERGFMSFGCEGKDFHLKPDHLTVTRPWQRHRVGNPNVTAGRLHWLILDVGVRRPHQPWRWPSWVVLTKHDVEDLTNMLRHNEQPVWPASPEIRGCFREIAECPAYPAWNSVPAQGICADRGQLGPKPRGRLYCPARESSENISVSREVQVPAEAPIPPTDLAICDQGNAGISESPNP